MELHERVREFTQQTLGAMGVPLDVAIVDDGRQRPGRAVRRRRRAAAAPPRRSARRAAAHRQHGVPPRAEGRPIVRRRLPRLPQGQGRRAAADGALPDGAGEDHRDAAGDRAAQPVRAPARAPRRRRGSADVVGEHRRRVPEDGHHLGVEALRQSPRSPARRSLAVFSPDDTIVAIATPPGRGGIGVVRLSGPEAHRVALDLTGRVEPLAAAARDVCADDRRVRRCRSGRRHLLPRAAFLHRRGRRRDQRARQPGGAARDRRARRWLQGSRLAEPGEFTLARVPERPDRSGAGGGGARSGRRGDAAAGARGVRSARGHADRPHPRDRRALFDLAARLEASLDFPDEGYHFVDQAEAARRARCDRRRCSPICSRRAARGRLIREGLQVAIAGRPNAGKSSLFNPLAGAGRAIVADHARDDARPADRDDRHRRRADDARRHRRPAQPPGDAVEAEGIARAVAARETAAADRARARSIGAADGRRSRCCSRRPNPRPRIVVANKADLPPAWDRRRRRAGRRSRFRRRPGAGLDALRRRCSERRCRRASRRVTRRRSRTCATRDLLERAREALERARDAAALQARRRSSCWRTARGARAARGGHRARTTDDVLNAIFAKFCIGK